MSIKHLSNIGGRLYYKRRFPQDLKDRLGPGEVWKYALDLKAGEELKARKLVGELARKHDAEIKRLRKHQNAKPTSQLQIYKDAVEFAKKNLLFVRAPAEYPEAVTPREEHRDKLLRLLGERAKADGYSQAELEELNRQDRLEQVLEEYLTDEEASLEQVLHVGGVPIPTPLTLDYLLEYEKEVHGIGRKNNTAYEQAVDQFLEFRSEHDVMTLQRKEVREWIGHLREVRGQGGETIGKRVSTLATMVGHFFDDHDIEKRNPFAGIKITRQGTAATKRLPFHINHLTLIENYLQKSSIGNDVRLILIIMKHTGVGPAEVGQMAVTDVQLDHDTPHILIRPNLYRENLKVKPKDGEATSVRERSIPLIGQGLEAVKEAVGERNEGALFPHVRSTDGSPQDGNTLSARLNKAIRAAGVPKSKRLTAYSFRHTLEEAMRVAEVVEHTQKRILGHTDSSMTGRYGAKSGLLKDLKAALEKTIPVLGEVERSNYSETEWVE